MRKLIISILLTLLLASGFLRDFVMKNINHVLKHLEEGAPNFSVEYFYFLENWKISNINILKWIMTIVFISYFWLLSYLLLKRYFNSESNDLDEGNPVKGINRTFISIISVSGLLYMIGVITNEVESIYPVVRSLIGMAQSFIPAMVVFLYMKYLPSQK